MGVTIEDLEVRLPCSLPLSSTQHHLSSPKKEYCPPVGPLDTATVRAIVSDYDLSNEGSLHELRETLDKVRTNTEIDAILVSLEADEDSSDAPKAGSSKSSSGPAASSNGHDSSSSKSNITLLTEELQAAQLGDTAAPAGPDDAPADYDTGIDELPKEEKLKLLREVVPNVKDFDAGFALAQNRGDFKKTLDELLTLDYIQNPPASDGEDPVAVPKGVEGFAEPLVKKKKKGKKKKNWTPLDARASDPTSEQSTPPWSASPAAAQPIAEPSTEARKGQELAEREIFFLSSCTNLGWDYVAHAYRNAGAHVGRAVARLCQCDQIVGKRRTIADARLAEMVAELGRTYWKLHPDDRTALVVLAYPSLDAAAKLAAELCRPDVENYADFVAKRAAMPAYRQPPAGAPPTPFSNAVKKPAPRQPFVMVQHAPKRPQLGQPSRHVAGAAGPGTMAFALRRHQALAQCAAAYRRGRSQPLMAGAAAHYAAEARALTARAAAGPAVASAAAEQHVAASATNVSVDLHGVGVRDAVGIALARVQAWWEASGAAEWARHGSIMGGPAYRLVVGAGNHSEGGRAKLGPAVKKALAVKGWRVAEEAPGVLVVKGRMRTG